MDGEDSPKDSELAVHDEVALYEFPDFEGEDERAWLVVSRGERASEKMSALLGNIEQPDDGSNRQTRLRAMSTLRRALSAHASVDQEDVSQLVDLLSPTLVPPPPDVVLQARRNAEARAHFLQEHGAVRSSGVADLAGSRARNNTALASRWRKERKIFSVEYKGVRYYPGFQFGPDGKPREVIAKVMLAFCGDDALDGREWQLALWFDARSGYLDDQRPVDLLETDPERIVSAMQRGRCVVF